MTGLKVAASNIGWAEDDDGRVLERMMELGFTGLEIAPTRVFANRPYSKVREFAAWAGEIEARYGLSVCSMQSNWRGRTESIFDDIGASALIDYTAEACNFAAAGGVKNLVFGCPSNRSVPQGHDGLEAGAFLRTCGRLAADSGAIFALEANPPMYDVNFLNTTAGVVDYLDMLEGARGLGLNLDVGAMVCAGESMGIVERAMPYVSHIHISEPGLAPIVERSLHRDLRDVLEEAGYSGYVSLEMGRAEFGAVSRCLEYLAETFLG